MPDERRDWEVWQNGRAVCCGMTKAAAENKVENERRLGWIMEVRRAAKPQVWVEEVCED
jgi:hypothetical protein